MTDTYSSNTDFIESPKYNSKVIEDVNPILQKKNSLELTSGAGSVHTEENYMAMDF